MARSSVWRSSSHWKPIRLAPASSWVRSSRRFAELYSELVGAETRTRRRIEPDQVKHIADDVAVVAIGIAFPALFFLLSAAGAREEGTAFTVAK
jgi:hypothetical protein